MIVFRSHVSGFGIFLVANIAIYLLVSAFLAPKGMFSGGAEDGFYSQIQHIASGSGWSTSPLYLVHLLRYVVVSPFYYVHVNGLSEFYESLLIVAFLLPVLCARFGGRRIWWQVLFVYLPLLFSFRAVLVMCAVAYLFICLFGDRRSSLKLLLSMMLANLSSGVVLPWVMIAGLNYKLLFERYKYVRPIALVAVVGLGFSAVHKFGFFFGDKSTGPSFFERNTFYVSIMNEQYLRFGVYLALFLAWMGICLCKLSFRQFSGSLFLFFVPAFVTLFFEGLGLISFMMPILWFYMSRRPTAVLLGMRWVN